MRTTLAAIVAIGVFTAGAAHAQYGGGGGRHGHGGGGPNPSGSTPAPGGKPAPPQAPMPANQIEIVGVVKSIAPDTGRITIAYGAVDALNWPAGATPFVVAKNALLKGITVGEKVRFKLDSEQISELKAF